MSGILASFSRGGTLPELLLNITNTASPDIPTLLANAGWKGVRQPVRLLNTALVNTLVIPSTLAGADITIENRSGAQIGGLLNGGTALRTLIPIKVDNLGSIWGGGGKGGSGRIARFEFTAPVWKQDLKYATGGEGGDGAGFRSPIGLDIPSAAPGKNGTSIDIVGYKAGSFNPFTGVYIAQSGRGGNGGVIGQKGDDGFNNSSGDFQGFMKNNAFDSAAANANWARPGEPAGYYINGNNLVTWINTGTRLGRVKA